LNLAIRSGEFDPKFIEPITVSSSASAITMMHSLGYKSGQVSPFSGLSDSPTLHKPDAVFNFNLIHATNSVIVENIPGHGEYCRPVPPNETYTYYIVQQREIISLFQTLIGM
jgi:hypothetical protein